MDEFLTVFTPTYNRVDLLSKLYQSLCSQNDQQFVWLIVDDGSNDKTSEIVEKWIAQKKIKITYVYQENAGKHAAHNRGVELCQTDLFMCVDSDDYLRPNAVGIIHSYWNEDCLSHENFIGYCTKKRGGSNFQINEASVNWPKENKLVYTFDLGNKYKYRGETALIWITNELKKYKFPVIKGEKFVTEIVLYFQFQKPMKVKNDVFYLFHYQPDGYTNQGFKLMAYNPIGTAIMFKYLYLSDHFFVKRFKEKLKYYAWIKCCGIKENTIEEIIRGLMLPPNKVEYQIFDFLTKPMGYISSFIFRRKFEKLNDR